MREKGFLIVIILIAGGIWYYEMFQSAGDSLWIGQYTYSEYAPPDENWTYDLAILSSSQSSFATLDINGFQTQISLTASVKLVSSGTIEFLFVKNNNPQSVLYYSPGDILFSLTKIRSGDKVAWDKLQPMLPQDINGAVFESVK